MFFALHNGELLGLFREIAKGSSAKAGWPVEPSTISGSSGHSGKAAGRASGLLMRARPWWKIRLVERARAVALSPPAEDGSHHDQADQLVRAVDHHQHHRL